MEALPLAKDAVGGFHRLSGSDDPLTLVAMELLAQVCMMMDKNELARPLIVAVHSSRSRVLGDLHQDTLTPLASLGVVLSNEGDHLAAQGGCGGTVIDLRREPPDDAGSYCQHGEQCY